MGETLAAAEQAGVSRVVYHSVLRAATPDMPHYARKAQVELHLQHSKLAWTVLQPAMYAQSALLFFDKSADLLTPALDPTRPFTPIHVEDLAEADARFRLTYLSRACRRHWASTQLRFRNYT